MVWRLASDGCKPTISTSTRSMANDSVTPVEENDHALDTLLNQGNASATSAAPTGRHGRSPKPFGISEFRNLARFGHASGIITRSPAAI